MIDYIDIICAGLVYVMMVTDDTHATPVPEGIMDCGNHF
jgi:hypothetical protein